MLRQRPELGSVVGLVPADARAPRLSRSRKMAVGSVDDFATEITATELDEATALPAVRSWVHERDGCSRSSRVHVLGSASLLRTLCDSKGSVEVDAIQILAPGLGSESLLAAYGSDVFDWARVVPVRSPAAVGVVVAPVGSQWRVIGVIEFPTHSTPQGG